MRDLDTSARKYFQCCLVELLNLIVANDRQLGAVLQIKDLHLDSFQLLRKSSRDTFPSIMLPIKILMMTITFGKHKARHL